MPAGRLILRCPTPAVGRVALTEDTQPEMHSLTLFITCNEHVLVAYMATGISVPAGLNTAGHRARGLTACRLEREAEQTTPCTNAT